MPKRSTIRARGGVRRIRTKRISPTQYLHIYITRKPGKHGGHTIASQVHRRKSK